MDNDTERLEAIARAALTHYDVAPDCDITLLNVSENATYLVAPPEGKRTILRVHRRGYHSLEAIESELAWVAALREADVVRAAPVLVSSEGRRVVEASHPDDGETRHAVMFEYLPGVEPPENRLVEDFQTVGAITARLHQHARSWTPPAGFTRFTWDFETSLGPRGHWGSWRDGMAVGPSEAEVLGRAADLMGRRLAAYGSGPDRFGLIHADMRLANLLVDIEHDNAVSVIDFDDCGFGWLMYDLGSSLSFIEHYPVVPELIDAWCTGYRTVAPISADDEAELETFVMFRRLLLVSWIGSHSATELAQDMGEEYTEVSCELAETYLLRHG
ncbi:MAG: phosphotransferase [Actinobacteria bacterium]|uniref:Unannotated protein n=1 Tax=freshwater metagenome TaxID=449393 RepID=A0A6J7Q2B5_9ZZZZ|nr:phosphotransferase [Actinomycetota bacterium]MSW41329.1 phosphotransferase [Actinomycetota bacterium]